MASRKMHPLTPLKKLRDDRADEAGRALGAALREETERFEQVSVQKAARARLLGEQDDVRTTEARAFEGGMLRAGDAVQAARWEIAARAKSVIAAENEAKAQKIADDAKQAVADSRTVVADKRADADAVERLLARARSAEQAKETAQLEEAAEETFASRAFRGARG